MARRRGRARGRIRPGGIAALRYRIGHRNSLGETRAAHLQRLAAAVVPSATDYDGAMPAGVRRHLPATDALDVSGRAFKEIVGRWAVLARGG